MSASLQDIQNKAKKDPCLYFLMCNDYVKVGVSFVGALEDRIAQMQTGNPYPLILADVVNLVGHVNQQKSRIAIERDIHASLQHLRVRGEWFRWNDDITSMISKFR